MGSTIDVILDRRFFKNRPLAIQGARYFLSVGPTWEQMGADCAQIAPYGSHDSNSGIQKSYQYGLNEILSDLLI